MDRYQIYFSSDISEVITVDAASYSEAVDIASEYQASGLCNYCAGHYEIGDLEPVRERSRVNGQLVGDTDG